MNKAVYVYKPDPGHEGWGLIHDGMLEALRQLPITASSISNEASMRQILESLGDEAALVAVANPEDFAGQLPSRFAYTIGDEKPSVTTLRVSLVDESPTVIALGSFSGEQLGVWSRYHGIVTAMAMRYLLGHPSHSLPISVSFQPTSDHEGDSKLVELLQANKDAVFVENYSEGVDVIYFSDGLVAGSSYTKGYEDGVRAARRGLLTKLSNTTPTRGLWFRAPAGLSASVITKKLSDANFSGLLVIDGGASPILLTSGTSADECRFAAVNVKRSLEQGIAVKIQSYVANCFERYHPSVLKLQ